MKIGKLVITLKEALKLSKEELENFKNELKAKIKANADLNAYIDVHNMGEGVPIAIKDNIQVKDWSVTSGSNILQGYTAPYNATVIEKMLGAGLSPFGRTNMDEFAMGSTTESSFYGKTLNPHNKDCVPGGSSGGSAAAVAAHTAIAALGSDTGGSIRQPASFCGIVGIKPTYGRVSRYGLIAHASSLDQIGPMTKTVEDAALILSVIAGRDIRDSTSLDVPVPDYCAAAEKSAKGLRVGLPKEYFGEGLDPEVRELTRRAVDYIASEGVEIVDIALPNLDYAIPTYYLIATAEASANLERYDGVRHGFRAPDAGNLFGMYAKTRALG